MSLKMISSMVSLVILFTLGWVAALIYFAIAFVIIVVINLICPTRIEDDDKKGGNG
jgi:F0F1-type ATP synthase assembly protein I